MTLKIGQRDSVVGLSSVVFEGCETRRILGDVNKYVWKWEVKLVRTILHSLLQFSFHVG